jgi:hypothetical protein
MKILSRNAMAKKDSTYRSGMDSDINNFQIAEIRLIWKRTYQIDIRDNF